MFIDNFSTNSKKKVGDFIEKQYQSPTYLFKKTPISLKSLLCKTSCAVSGHASFCTVTVEYAHFNVRHVGIFNKDYSVGADAVMSVAYAYAQRFGACDVAEAVVKEYVVVSAALHL